jgi:hypothetical protein
MLYHRHLVTQLLFLSALASNIKDRRSTFRAVKVLVLFTICFYAGRNHESVINIMQRWETGFKSGSPPSRQCYPIISSNIKNNYSEYSTLLSYSSRDLRTIWTRPARSEMHDAVFYPIPAKLYININDITILQSTFEI